MERTKWGIGLARAWRLAGALALVAGLALVAVAPPGTLAAGEGYDYIDENGVQRNTGTTPVTELTGSGAGETLSGGGWYIVLAAGVTRSSTVTVSGHAYLILADGASLTVNGDNHDAGIRVPFGNSLTIYGQALGNGTLTANGSAGGAGIGGHGFGGSGGLGGSGGNITISGGTVNANGGNDSNGGGAGIGGGCYSGGDGGGGFSSITISGGTVTANGGYGGYGGGAGIGSGGYGLRGSITISGGTINANGSGFAAGIGGGGYGGGDGDITISGGTINANGGGFAAGIGGGCYGRSGSVAISGGTVFAKGGPGGRDIGPGFAELQGTLAISGSAAVFLRNDNCIAPATTTHVHRSITGHTAGALIHGIAVGWAGDLGAWLNLVGYGYDYIDENGVQQNTGTTPVTALMGSGAGETLSDGGWYIVLDAGVTRSSTVTVSGHAYLILADGASLTVNGDNYNAGIRVPPGSSLTIYGQALGTGTLTANGSEYAAGIGGGYYGDGGSVTICGGTVTANGGYLGAGIGGGLGGDGGSVTITGGTVTAKGSDYAAGIGGGSYGGGGGDITISGGTVTANGGSLAAGIGGYGGSGSVTISGGTVTANSGDGGGAGIGGSYDGGGGDITISGGQVTATGRGGGAGIGDGCWGAGGNVTISGGQVTATGRDGGPGVGKGSDESGAILIAPPAGILIDVYVGSQAPGSPLAGSPFAEETAYTGTDQYFHSLARPLTYTIAPIADQTMTPLVVGYADGDQETKPITIERTGTGDLTHLAVALGGAHPGSYVITQPLATTLDDSTTSTTFTVKAAPGLTVGTYTATVTISATNMADVTINVIQEVAPAAPIITTSSLPNGTVGTPYSQTLAATGDTPITWSIAAGDLPDGLTLAGNTISGTPTTAGIFSFTVRATNSAGDDAKGLSITINSAAPLCTRADVAAVIYGAPEGTPVRAYVGGTEQPTLYSAHDAFGRQAVLWTFYPPASTDWTVRVEPQLPPGLEAPRWQYKLVWIEPAPPGFVSGAAAGSAVTVSRCSGTVLHFQLVDTGAQ